MKTELTAADLALYLGAICMVEKSDGNIVCDYDDGGMYLMSAALIHLHGAGKIVAKPILRPLSDMTEEEEMEVQYLVDIQGFGYDALIGAKITQYLLSRHFDLFGWIEAGLAIDKTKLETK